MWLLVAEAVIALGILAFVVWWTVGTRRRDPTQRTAPPDGPAAAPVALPAPSTTAAPAPQTAPPGDDASGAAAPLPPPPGSGRAD